MGKGKYLVSYVSNPHKLLLGKKRGCLFNYSNCLVNILIFSKCLFSFTCHSLYAESVIFCIEVMAHIIQLCKPIISKMTVEK